MQQDKLPCGADNGSIRINASGGTGELEFSIDGTTFQLNNEFRNLPKGEYTVYVRDENQCEVSAANVSVTEADALVLAAVDPFPSTCGIANGRI